MANVDSEDAPPNASNSVSLFIIGDMARGCRSAVAQKVLHPAQMYARSSGVELRVIDVPCPTDTSAATPRSQLSLEGAIDREISVLGARCRDAVDARAASNGDATKSDADGDVDVDVDGESNMSVAATALEGATPRTPHPADVTAADTPDSDQGLAVDEEKTAAAADAGRGHGEAGNGITCCCLCAAPRAPELPATLTPAVFHVLCDAARGAAPELAARLVGKAGYALDECRALFVLRQPGSGSDSGSEPHGDGDDEHTQSGDTGGKAKGKGADKGKARGKATEKGKSKAKEKRKGNKGKGGHGSDPGGEVEPPQAAALWSLLREVTAEAEAAAEAKAKARAEAEARAKAEAEAAAKAAAEAEAASKTKKKAKAKAPSAAVARTGKTAVADAEAEARAEAEAAATLEQLRAAARFTNSIETLAATVRGAAEAQGISIGREQVVVMDGSHTPTSTEEGIRLLRRSVMDAIEAVSNAMVKQQHEAGAVAEATDDGGEVDLSIECAEQARYDAHAARLLASYAAVPSHADTAAAMGAYFQSAGENVAAPLLLVGGEGSGKSALIASVTGAAMQRASASSIATSTGSAAAAVVIRRTVGLSRRSADLDSCLFSLAREIAGAYGTAADVAAVPPEYEVLAPSFAGEYLSRGCPARPLLIAIDGISRWREQPTWVPDLLPNAHVRLVLSATAETEPDETGDCADAGAGAGAERVAERVGLPRARVLRVPVMVRADAQCMLEAWQDAEAPAAAGSGGVHGECSGGAAPFTLTQQQVAALLGAFDACPSPLFLVSAYHEARTRWHSFTPLPEMMGVLLPRSIAPSLHGADSPDDAGSVPAAADIRGGHADLFERVIERLRLELGAAFVNVVLALLSAVRAGCGLSHEELLHMASSSSLVARAWQSATAASSGSANGGDGHGDGHRDGHRDGDGHAVAGGFRVPASHWLLLRAELGPFLSCSPGEGGVDEWHFSHEAWRAAARQCQFEAGGAARVQRLIAAHYLGAAPEQRDAVEVAGPVPQPNVFGSVRRDDSEDLPHLSHHSQQHTLLHNVRKLLLLPHHLARAHMVAEWVTAMTDLRFIAAKCAALADGSFEVVRDFKDKRLFAPPEDDSDSEGGEGGEGDREGGNERKTDFGPACLDPDGGEDERGERELVN